MKTFILAATSAFTLMNVANAALLSGPTINPNNGHTYYLLTEDTWQNSEAQGITLGGHLATINDSVEQAWVYSTFGNYGAVDRSLWIGLWEPSVEGQYSWVSGEPVTYTHWINTQPDNANGNESYVHMVNAGNIYGHAGGLWNDLASPNVDFPTFNPISGVIEVVPEPTSVGLTILGIGGILGFRKRTTRF